MAEDPAATLIKRAAASLNVAPTDALETDLATATLMVDRHIADANGVPDQIRETAIVKTACELYEQRSAPNGVRNFADMDGITPVRVARDPMTGAYPILAPFLPLGIS